MAWRKALTSGSPIGPPPCRRAGAPEERVGPAFQARGGPMLTCGNGQVFADAQGELPKSLERTRMAGKHDDLCALDAFSG